MDQSQVVFTRFRSLTSAQTQSSLYKTELTLKFEADFTKKSSRQQQLQLFLKTQKLENHHLKMRFSLSFLLVITLILGVLLPALEAASTRRRGGRVQKYRGGRSRPAFRRGPLRRRGRQEDEDVVEDDVEQNIVLLAIPEKGLELYTCPPRMGGHSTAVAGSS